MFILNTQPRVTREHISGYVGVEYVQRNSAFWLWHWRYEYSLHCADGVLSDVVVYSYIINIAQSPWLRDYGLDNRGIVVRLMAVNIVVLSSSVDTGDKMADLWSWPLISM